LNTRNNRDVKVFGGTASHYLAENVAREFNITLGDVKVTHFSDGEFSPAFDESVRGCDVFIIQSTFAPTENLFELLLLIDAAKRASAHYITAVIPYFGFARSDRKDKPRVAIAAKMVANLLTAAGVTRVMTMDLHAPQIQGFFDVPVDHLDSSTIFVPYIKNLGLDKLLIASPDMGGVHRARTYAKYFSAEMAICDKQRKRANEIESMTVIGNVEGMDVVLVDDIIDTAGTITKAAELLKERGANSVRACCTHAVLSGKAYERLENSVLEEIIVTDSIPLRKESKKIVSLETGKLFAMAIQRVYEYESINNLFINP
jgi:ribose-phosphate pyrophosphokinase